MMWVPTITVANSGIATTDVSITHTTSNNHIRAVFDATNYTGTLLLLLSASDGVNTGTGTIIITTMYTAKKVNSQEN